MQTWWFMRRMDWKVADVHENAIINMCERSTVGNRPHQMQSWALATRCGYALAKDLDQVLCKEAPPEQCTQCERLHQCSYMIFQLTIMEQNHHGSPCILGKNPSNSVPWDQAVEPYLLWQLSVNLMRRCWKTPRGLMRIGPGETVSWQWRGLLMVEEFRTCLCLSQLSFWM